MLTRLRASTRRADPPVLTTRYSITIEIPTTATFPTPLPLRSAWDRKAVSTLLVECARRPRPKPDHTNIFQLRSAVPAALYRVNAASQSREATLANVFISHAGADSAAAEQVRQWLEQDGHHSYLDRHLVDGNLPGDEWEKRLFEELRKADAVVCIVTEAYLGSVWCAAEIGAARALGSELLPLRFCSGEVFHPLLKPIHGVDAILDPEGTRERLALKLGIIDGTGGLGWPDDKSPYPGLRPFDLGEHRVFFGRNLDIQKIAEELRSPANRSRSILAVVGPSGCGKSSLVRAGVLPRIAGQRDWLPLAPMVPGIDPLPRLARELAAAARRLDVDVTPLRGDVSGDTIAKVANDLLLASDMDSQCKLLVVIDQFEELVTQTERAERAEFASALACAVGGPIQVLATLRPEFLDVVLTDPDLSELPLRMYPIRPLESDALRSVIEGPARIAGIGVEDGLVSRLVADTGSGDALPLLAYTLEQLAHGVTRGGQLEHQRYVDIGGVQGALARQAEAALQDACRQAAVGRDEVIAALLNLVTINEQGRPTKRRAALDELPAKVADVLQPFIERRLLSTEAGAERTFVTVAHDAFLNNWAPLTDEIDAQVIALRARRVVENAANDWSATGRDDSALLQGKQLTKATVDIGANLESAPRPKAKLRPARQLVTRVELNDTGRDFLEASMRADRRRRLRLVVQVASVVLVLAIVAATAVVGFVRANIERDRAQASARQAIGSRLLAESSDILSQSLGRGDIVAFQKLIAAHALVGDAAEGGILDAVVQRQSTAKVIDAGGPARGVVFSPDGRQLAATTGAATTGTGTVRVWDAATGQQVTGFEDPTGYVGRVAFSPDGRRLATASGSGGTVQLWDAHTGQPSGTLAGHTDSVIETAFSPDGRQLASVGADMTVRLWDASTGRPRSPPLTGHTDQIVAVAFSPDGRRLATGGYDGTVRLWNPDTGQPLGTLAGHTGWVMGIAFSPDGHRLASAGREGDFGGSVRLWNVDTLQQVGEPLTDHTGAVMDVVYSPDGHRLATAGYDNTVRLWDAFSGQRVGAPLIGHTDIVGVLSFSPDGTRLASGSEDGTVRVWDLYANRTFSAPDVVVGMAFSPDGRRLASALADNTVRLWNADTGEPDGAPLTGHTDALADVAWSPDGHRLASAGDDNTVRLWNADTGQPVGAPLTGHTSWLTSVEFSPDGHRLASAGDDGRCGCGTPIAANPSAGR